VKRAVTIVLLLALATPVAAHNVAVSHPEITDVALEALRQADIDSNGGGGTLTDPCDVCAYNELWEHRGMVTPPGSGIADHSNYTNAFNSGTATLMVGVVIEDGPPVIRVLNHFYHAITGVGLFNSNNSSQTRAEELFHYALELHDYTDTSQDRSYIYAGRVLHHVEDMSSPAHVHNDAHLYAFGLNSDKDDYEGRWVPAILWQGGTLRDELTSPPPVPRVINSANDIWSDPVAGAPANTYSPPENSLSGFVFNRTTYRGNLQYPTDGVPPPPALAELAEMFPGDVTDPSDDGLFWHSPIIGFDRWVIDGVGEYHYKASWGSEDDWWPDTASNEMSAGDPHNLLAPYYLEQLMSGDTADTALEPERLRQDWTVPWNATTNPVLQNTVCTAGPTPGAACSKDADCAPGTCDGASIVALQADHLLGPAAEYVAGMAQWWFRYANLPPYLEKVEASQGGVGVKYTAMWDVTPDMETRSLAEIGFDTHEEIEVENTRTFNYNPLDRKYINALDDLTLTLEFNEPIRDISEMKLLDENGTLVLDLLDLVTTQGGMPSKSMDHDIWTYTILQAGLTNLPALNGELTLKVMAQDRNEHEQDGGELDATPNSPAKRNLTGPFDLRAPDIPWHTDQSNEDFVYDFMTGDRNHRLLFDTVKPITTIGVTP